jgi:hypothetical protein
MMLLLAAALFVGGEACRPCHAPIYESYFRTAMARSSGKAAGLAAAKFTAAGHRYGIESDRLTFDQGSSSIDFFIGSGAAGRSFLFQREGYLYELPVTWYARPARWDASPGYERDTEVRLDRAVDWTCLWCHASRVRPVLGTQNRYGEPPFWESGVGCERCHGPGSEHVRDPATARMVNPAKLDPERRDSICTQCHLTGAARIERHGRTLREFRAGERLADYVTYWVWNPPAADLEVTSHVEKLAASACKRAAGDALWCGTCHEPHTGTNRSQTACVECHQAAHHRRGQCASCHMPRAAAADAPHGVFTDHSIPRRAQRPAPPARRELIALVGTADLRSQALAYAEVRDRRARELLEKVRPADAKVLLHLAAAEQDPARAASLYEAILGEDPGRPEALVNLGVLYARSGRLAEAAKLWQRALEVNPAIEGAALNLASIRTGAEARAVLERYLEFNPGSTAVRARLRQP